LEKGCPKLGLLVVAFGVKNGLTGAGAGVKGLSATGWATKGFNTG